MRCGFLLALVDIFCGRQVAFDVLFSVLERGEVVTAAADQLPSVASFLLGLAQGPAAEVKILAIGSFQRPEIPSPQKLSA
jgi:hypothetical protein